MGDQGNYPEGDGDPGDDWGRQLGHLVHFVDQFGGRHLRVVSGGGGETLRVIARRGLLTLTGLWESPVPDDLHVLLRKSPVVAQVATNGGDCHGLTADPGVDTKLWLLHP